MPTVQAPHPESTARPPGALQSAEGRVSPPPPAGAPRAARAPRRVPKKALRATTRRSSGRAMAGSPRGARASSRFCLLRCGGTGRVVYDMAWRPGPPPSRHAPRRAAAQHPLGAHERPCARRWPRGRRTAPPAAAAAHFLFPRQQGRARGRQSFAARRAGRGAARWRRPWRRRARRRRGSRPRGPPRGRARLRRGGPSRGRLRGDWVWVASLGAPRRAPRRARRRARRTRASRATWASTARAWSAWRGSRTRPACRRCAAAGSACCRTSARTAPRPSTAAPLCRGRRPASGWRSTARTDRSRSWWPPRGWRWSRSRVTQRSR